MASLDVTIPNLKLSNGASMPMLGYGTGTAWFKNGEESKIDQATIDAVKTAMKLNYTHLDGAEGTSLFYDVFQSSTDGYIQYTRQRPNSELPSRRVVSRVRSFSSQPKLTTTTSTTLPVQSKPACRSCSWTMLTCKTSHVYEEVDV
jgi:hypothetical protein